MNREQAINYLKSSGMSEEQIKDIISALTCEDCISRQAVLDCLKATKLKQSKKFDLIIEIRNEVMMLPPVTLKPKSDVLDKIRAEIMAIGNWTTKSELPNEYLVKVLEIIDKYRESEDKE